MIKWISLGVLAVYLTLQVLAAIRLKGAKKKQGNRVLFGMTVCLMLQSWVRDVFENQKASRLAALLVGMAALVACGVLMRILGDRSDGAAIGEEERDNAIQSLKLS